MVEGFDGRVELVVDDFGDSALGDRFGVQAYPAIFIDDVLVATPRDFWDWGSKARGRYTPWREAEGREAFVADMTDMLTRRLANGSLDIRPAQGDGAAAQDEARLPAVVLTDLDGQAIDTASWAGRAVVVAFWAPWCPPCQDSLPWLLGLSKRLGDGVEVLALALQTDEEAVRAALAGHAGSARVALATADHADAFGGVMAVPTLMVFDSGGSLAAVFHGAPSDLHPRVEAVLAGLSGSGPEGAGHVSP